MASEETGLSDAGGVAIFETDAGVDHFDFRREVEVEIFIG